VQDAPVGNCEQGLLERPKQYAREHLLDEGRRRAAGYNSQDFFAWLKKRRKETQFGQKISLMRFNLSFVITFMVRE
jgi:hypothetical protein